MGERKIILARIEHVKRKKNNKLEHVVPTKKLEGKRDRGRPKEKILDGLARWHGK